MKQSPLAVLKETTDSTGKGLFVSMGLCDYGAGR
jgi:hypothetical protein